MLTHFKSSKNTKSIKKIKAKIKQCAKRDVLSVTQHRLVFMYCLLNKDLFFFISFYTKISKDFTPPLPPSLLNSAKIQCKWSVIHWSSRYIIICITQKLYSKSVKRERKRRRRRRLRIFIKKKRYLHYHRLFPLDLCTISYAMIARMFVCLYVRTCVYACVLIVHTQKISFTFVLIVHSDKLVCLELF